jgi:DNA-binding transcriptional ArsR family regulator
MTSTAPRVYPDDLLTLVASRFRLLGDATRLRILLVLREGEHSVGAIAEAAATSQANTSKHLAALLEAGAVARRRASGNTFYRVTGRVVFLLFDAVCSGLDSQATQQQELVAAARRPLAGGSPR